MRLRRRFSLKVISFIALLPILAGICLTALGYDFAFSLLGFVLSSIIGLVCYSWLQREPNLIYRLGEPKESKAAFHELLAMGEKAVPLFLKALSAPSGTLISIASFSPPGSLNWDGNRVRRLAAEGLGRLKVKDAVEPLIQVLDDSDKVLRAKAIWALGEIRDARAVPTLLTLLNDRDVRIRAEAARALGKLGDPRAIPPLISLLGEEREVPEASGDYWHLEGCWVNERAVEALRKLGQSDLVDAFLRVLEYRDQAALERLKVHPYQKRVIEAFVRALDSPFVERVVNAAWALGELGASEALPKLRAKVSPISFADEQVKEACQQAIAKLKPLTTLPRPACASKVGKETLPRPAKASEVDKDKLPRLPNEM